MQQISFPKLEDLAKNDPDFVKFFKDFAFEEVIVDTASLDSRRRYLSHLAVLLGSQALSLYQEVLVAALESGVTASEIKEVLYQAVAYLGLGRVHAFLQATNSVLQARGTSLPLQGAKSVVTGSRLEKGEAVQLAIFGEQMRGFAQQGDEASRHINKWLVDNCFGDYYSRDGLSYAERELMTFCYLYAQGACEPQLKGHTAANLQNGNDKDLLIAIVSANIPYIGYPRSLNALAIIKEIAQKEKE